MTEWCPGWPWVRSLPYPRNKVRPAIGQQEHDSSAGEKLGHGQIPDTRRISAATAQGASAKASRSSKRF